jgi:hypothetical protein
MVMMLTANAFAAAADGGGGEGGGASCTVHGHVNTTPYLVAVAIPAVLYSVLSDLEVSGGVLRSKKECIRFFAVNG